MPSKIDNTTKFHQNMKSDKVTYIIYADKKIDGLAYNPEKLSTTKTLKQKPCRYLMSTMCTFDHTETKQISCCRK